jgi:hypothetical protein
MRFTQRLARRLSRALGTAGTPIELLMRNKRKSSRILRHSQPAGLVVEFLEDRLLLSATPVATPTFLLAGRTSVGAKPSQTTGASAPFTPAQITTAYGVNEILFNGTPGTGAGQTIAIVDAYNDPDIISDANVFSSEFGLPEFNGSGEPTLKVLNETGGTSLPSNAAKGGWDVEESLDVEWAHSIAPDANIILFEANSNSLSDLFTAVTTAADTSGVSVVSMSWSGSEFSTETSYDSDFVHTGITFLAATGDTGTPSGYPAFSPDVVAVGGTSLSIESNGTYISETVWDNSYGASGGGISEDESLPSYQDSLDGINGASTTHRNVPDVSMDADPTTGVYVLDSYYSGSQSEYLEVGGTSLATPMWAGLVSIADQGRVLDGESTLSSAQTLQTLYSLPSSDFHDITTGTNGTYKAGPGYDLATGIGTPVANLLVPGLAGTSTTPPTPTAPTITAPASATLTENSSLPFTGSDAITLSDPSGGSNSDTLTLSVSYGTLSLTPTSGVIITDNGQSSITATGTITSLQTAVSSLTYTPTSGRTGGDTLNIGLSDPTDGLSATPRSVVLTITAASAPTIAAPTSVSFPENDSLEFNDSSILITDTSAGSSSQQLKLTATNGTLTLGSTSGITFISGKNRSASMTIGGTLANLNKALDNLIYTPTENFTGSASIGVSYTDEVDNLTASATITLTVTARSRGGFGDRHPSSVGTLQPFRNASGILELGPSVQAPFFGSSDGSSDEQSNRSDAVFQTGENLRSNSGGEAFVVGSNSGTRDTMSDSGPSDGCMQSGGDSASDAATLLEGLRAALEMLAG